MQLPLICKPASVTLRGPLRYDNYFDLRIAARIRITAGVSRESARRHADAGSRIRSADPPQLSPRRSRPAGEFSQPQRRTHARSGQWRAPHEEPLRLDARDVFLRAHLVLRARDARSG